MATVRDVPQYAGEFGARGARTAAANVAARVLADRAEGEAYVASVCFKHGPPRLLGVELEYTVHHLDDPSRPVDLPALAAALAPHTPRTIQRDGPAEPLPGGSVLTLEPGAQVEISTVPRDSLAELAAVATADLAYLTERLARAGFTLGNTGIDAFRAPCRVLSTERYAAMQRRFAPMGDGGITMMCSTAALQVCVDAGDRRSFAGRWAAVHALGPVLLALFANSPRHAARDTGHASARWLSVMATERARTRPPDVAADPVAAWARRVLATPLMVLRRDDGPWDAPPGMTFADWIDGRGFAAGLGRPTTADLDYHLTTMFTPVRPKGYLEVRYLDAQPPDRWLAPVALLSALLGAEQTVDRVLELCAPVAGRWEDAARHGLADPSIRRAAGAVADLGCAALPGTGLPPPATAEIAESVQRTVRREGDRP